MAQSQTYIAGNKFGLGLRPGDLEKIGAKPRQWLLDQLEQITELPSLLSEVRDSAHYISSGINYTRQSQQVRAQTGTQQVDPAMRQDMRRQRRDLQQEQLRHYQLRLQAAINTDAPFAERLVRFWLNHFTVSNINNKPALRTSLVAYENEAIRANLNGNFENLVLAVEQHPCMLFYLDNIQSMGPNSRFGERRERGLNENLAREILELHTLGVDGGYTQQDVGALANIITGWSVNIPGARVLGGNKRFARQIQSSEAGAFQFNQAMHEPGAQVLLGKRYGQSGVEQGRKALSDLVQHPSTAVFIATKLARHFISDAPPQSAINQLAKVFNDTDGHLPSVHRELLNIEGAWNAEHKKLKTPEEFVISTARGLIGRVNQEKQLQTFLSAQIALNQKPFTANSPAGWPDNAEHWGSPDALLKRIEWISQIAERYANSINPRDIVTKILLPNDHLQESIARAESGAQATAILFASPQFQWR